MWRVWDTGAGTYTWVSWEDQPQEPGSRAPGIPRASGGTHRVRVCDHAGKGSYGCDSASPRYTGQVFLQSLAGTGAFLATFVLRQRSV